MLAGHRRTGRHPRLREAPLSTSLLPARPEVSASAARGKGRRQSEPESAGGLQGTPRCHSHISSLRSVPKTNAGSRAHVPKPRPAPHVLRDLTLTCNPDRHQPPSGPAVTSAVTLRTCSDPSPPSLHGKTAPGQAREQAPPGWPGLIHSQHGQASGAQNTALPSCWAPWGHRVPQKTWQDHLARQMPPWVGPSRSEGESPGQMGKIEA